MISGRLLNVSSTARAHRHLHIHIRTKIQIQIEIPNQMPPLITLIHLPKAGHEQDLYVYAQLAPLSRPTRPSHIALSTTSDHTSTLTRNKNRPRRPASNPPSPAHTSTTSYTPTKCPPTPSSRCTTSLFFLLFSWGCVPSLVAVGHKQTVAE